MSQQSPSAEEEFQFKAEIQRVLNILIHSLYQHREIFLRELISNASDALNKMRFELLTNRNVLEPDKELVIQIEIDKKEKTLTIKDTGIGMTKDEIINNIGTIASSGSLKFLEKIKEQSEQTGSSATNLDIIGKFGVGFYSVFMVAKEVKIITRSYKLDAEGAEWTSNGIETYKIHSIDKKDRGTEIIVYFRDDVTEFTEEFKIRDLVKKYSDFVTFPIQIKKEKKEAPSKEGEEKKEEQKEKQPEFEWEVINKQQALWKRSASEITEEQYKEFFKHISGEFEDPLHYLHFSVEGATQFRALLYIPKKRNRNLFIGEPDWGLKVYNRNVLIQEKNREVLPEYFRYLKGVVDSEDLPLNVSRETLQATKVLTRIKKSLVAKVIAELERLAKDDSGKYMQFWKEFGIFVKEGVASDPSTKDKLIPLLRFHSTKSIDEELTSLPQYIEKMKTDQDTIYYLVADNLTTAKTSPHLDYYISNDIEVILMTEPVDSFLMVNLRDYKDKKFQNIDQAIEDKSKDKEKKAEEEPVSLKDLITRFKTVLGDKVADVKTSDRLVNSPVRLVTPAGGMNSDMEKVLHYMSQANENEKNKSVMSKRILEINKDHKIVQNLESLVLTDEKNPLIDLTINQLYNNVALQDGIFEKPADMVNDIQKLLEIASTLAVGK